MKRRTVLRALGIGIAGSGAVSGTASAATPDGDSFADHDGDGVQLPVPGGIDVHHFHDHAHVRGFTYVGSLAIDDTCFFSESACVIGGSGTLIWLRKALSKWWPAAAVCAGIVGGCQLREVVRRFAPNQIEYVDFYWQENAGRWVAMPRVVY